MEPKKLTVQRWSDISSEPLSEANVRALHVPAERYRVSLYRYDAGEKIAGGMRAGQCFVLAGHCQLEFGAQVAQVSAGDVATFPEGRYRLEVSHEAEWVAILAWKLPKAFARRIRKPPTGSGTQR